MISPARAVIVTIGLAVVGTVVGALTAAVAMTLVGAVWLQALVDWDMIVLALWFGAPIGAVAAPLISWLLMRRVPIWKAILHTAVGSALLAVIAFPLPFSFLWAPLTGFLIAATRLHLIARRQHRAIPPVGDVTEPPLVAGGAPRPGPPAP